MAGMEDFIATHRGLVIGGGTVLVLVVAGALFSKKQTVPTATPNSNLGGLTNGTVYVPTQTEFYTYNQGQFSNDPLLTAVTNSGNTTTTTTSTKTVSKAPVPTPNPVPKPPDRTPPPPQPQPPPTRGKALIWDQRYTIVGGDTLSAIAARKTRELRMQGMPGSTSITWSDLYGHNTSVITSTAAAHHNPIPGGPWNDIFPGETITVPRWG